MLTEFLRDKPNFRRRHVNRFLDIVLYSKRVIFYDLHVESLMEQALQMGKDLDFSKEAKKGFKYILTAKENTAFINSEAEKPHEPL